MSLEKYRLFNLDLNVESETVQKTILHYSCSDIVTNFITRIRGHEYR